MTITVSCRLEPEYITQLKKLSDRTDRTVSRILRRIVIDALTQPEKPAAKPPPSPHAGRPPLREANRR